MTQATHANGKWTATADTELLALVRRGEREAFRTIMQRYNQRLYRVARGIVADDAEAEDVVQESWVRAFAALNGFRGDAALLTWLTRIVINEARGRLRRRRPRADLSEVETAQQSGSLIVAFPGGRPVENPEEEAARAQARSLLERAVDRLPEPFRMVFLLRDVQELTIEESASILGVRPETIKTRLFRARRQLRNILDATLADALHGSFPFMGLRCERMTAKVLDRLGAQRGWTAAH
ncbi:MAG: RNA polymerase sigma factor [Proteobacteria bacterium]|nr:RNA polymerase sigma factor [Pseudomonadota bacterium]MDE2411350.1 RNA polymerase sigma factor [Sphingomonadales bacterium]